MAIRSPMPMDQRMADAGGRVLVVCSDLFFSTQVASMVRAAGFEAVLEMQSSRAAGLLSTGCWAGVVVDVDTSGLDLAALIGALGPEPRPRVVAFGPHVQTSKLEAASAAGCNAVLTRGQVSSNPQGLKIAILGDRPAAGCQGACEHGVDEETVEIPTFTPEKRQS